MSLTSRILVAETVGIERAFKAQEGKTFSFLYVELLRRLLL
jgi:hypothetical protein